MLNSNPRMRQPKQSLSSKAAMLDARSHARTSRTRSRQISNKADMRDFNNDVPVRKRMLMLAIVWKAKRDFKKWSMMQVQHGPPAASQCNISSASGLPLSAGHYNATCQFRECAKHSIVQQIVLCSSFYITFSACSRGSKEHFSAAAIHYPS